MKENKLEDFILDLILKTHDSEKNMLNLFEKKTIFIRYKKAF